MTLTFTDWLASTFGTTVILVALIGAFWKVILNHITSSVKHKYEKELETHKANLKRDYDVQIESLKAELRAASDRELEQLKARLQTAASERNIKLTSTFEKQGEVIAKVYKHLLALQEATEKMRGVTLTTESVDEARLSDELGKANRDFVEHFFPNEIYLPNDVARLVHKFALALKHTLHHQHFTKVLENRKITNPATEESLRRRYELLDKLEMEIPDLLTSLRNEFQNILGVKLPDQEMKKTA
jgi:hypothetical protein